MRNGNEINRIKESKVIDMPLTLSISYPAGYSETIGSRLTAMCVSERTSGIVNPKPYGGSNSITNTLCELSVNATEKHMVIS